MQSLGFYCFDFLENHSHSLHVNFVINHVYKHFNPFTVPELYIPCRNTHISNQDDSNLLKNLEQPLCCLNTSCNHDSVVESESNQLPPKHAIHQLFTNMQSNDFYTWFLIRFHQWFQCRLLYLQIPNHAIFCCSNYPPKTHPSLPILMLSRNLRWSCFGAIVV